MNISESEQIFYDKSQIYWKWLTKINSRRLNQPIHFIWITDKSDNDNTKMVLTKSNQIVGAVDHTRLYKYLEDHKEEIPDPVNTFTWLNEVRDLEDISVTEYHLDNIENALNISRFNKATVYECINFINLFTDLAGQLEDESLFELSGMRQVRDLWKFGSYEIFWKEWGNEEIPAVKIPPFLTNFTLLKKRMNLLIDTFLGRIDIIDQKKNNHMPKKERSRRFLRIARTKSYRKK